jgi:putative phosphoribosyl transferase
MSRDFDVQIPVPGGRIAGTLVAPNEAEAIVLFAHGSGSSRLSPRNQLVAEVLRRGGFGTLLLDLLTPDEVQTDDVTREFRFDIALLAGRVVAATDWLIAERLLPSPHLGYFGSSSGAAAALVAAVKRPATVGAIVSRGGRPELAAGILTDVTAPTLFIVGEHDDDVIELNEAARSALASQHKDLRIVPGASHLFEEPGALEEVADLAREWFENFLLIQPGMPAGSPATP